MHGFDKHTYTLEVFLQDFIFVLTHIPQAIGAYASGRVPWAMAEKIMLAVTAVNGCVHCARFHGALAKLSGVEAEAVTGMLRMELGTEVSEYERPALQFAQEYAQTERHPQPENVLELRRFYGKAAADDIMLYIRLIMLGNLTGNTFDALLERILGRPSAQSTVWDELPIAMLAIPFIALINGFAAWDKFKDQGHNV